MLEAAVLGLPDERKGEVPVAAVRIAPGATFDADALKKWAAERLSDYKVPQQIVAVDELPRTGTNKVQRKELISLFTALKQIPSDEHKLCPLKGISSGGAGGGGGVDAEVDDDVAVLDDDGIVVQVVAVGRRPACRCSR